MGRKGTGVEIRERSIRLSFTFNGKQERHTLTLDDVPMLPTPANVKYAHRLAIEIKEKIRHRTFSLAEYFPKAVVEDAGTVGGQLDTWLAAQRIESSTREGYASAIKFWKHSICDRHGARLGTIPLRSAKLSHFLTVIAGRPDLSGKTINNYVSVVREALDLAVKDRILADNPASEIPRAKYQREPPDPFSRSEMERILEAVRQRFPGQVHNLIEFWFWSGLRTSEVFGLQWPNVDLASGSVLVAEALVRGERKDRTKTAVARQVILNSRALAAIQSQRQHTQVAGAAVFNDPRYAAQWEDERAFRRSFWTPTLKLLGIRYRRPYNMRHTYATVMLMAGMTPAFCAKQLGHSVEMFLKTYSKWLDGDQNELEMRRLETAISPQNLPEKTKQAPKRL